MMARLCHHTRYLQGFFAKEPAEDDLTGVLGSNLVSLQLGVSPLQKIHYSC
jgi:hypothetical protein